MKNKYKVVLFDMDGTLTDTSEGIYNCHKHTLVQMGREEPTIEYLSDVIGSPLLKSYEEKFNFSKEDAKKAVGIYRKEYELTGIYQAKLYDGILETLTELKLKGYSLAVATLKAERFAKVMLLDMNISHLFNVIHGVDLDDKITKAGLINLCLTKLNCSPNDAVLVGDSIHDYYGAKEAQVDFIGATYGFGLKSQQELNLTKKLISSPIELLKYL